MNEFSLTADIDVLWLLSARTTSTIVQFIINQAINCSRHRVVTLPTLSSLSLSPSLMKKSHFSLSIQLENLISLDFLFKSFPLLNIVN